jgi:hypothetical protein
MQMMTVHQSKNRYDSRVWNMRHPKQFDPDHIAPISWDELAKIKHSSRDIPESRRREKQTATQHWGGAREWLQCQTIPNVVQLCFICTWWWENHGKRTTHLRKLTAKTSLRLDAP